MAAILPIAVILPHSGLAVPPELDGRVTLTPAQLFNEADVYSDLLYAFQDHVLHWEAFPYARACLDVNRPAPAALGDAPFTLRPGDGVVKWRTSYGAPVYAPGAEPDAALEAHLLHTYWEPWHARLAAIAADPRVRAVFDCHSMAAFGPSHYDDPAAPRPRFQVANLGGPDGAPDPRRGRVSASAEWTRQVAAALARRAPDLPTLVPTGPAARINQPFFGGWDLWAHGHPARPWVMIEVSRALYIGAQSGDSPPVGPEPVQIGRIRDALWDAVAEVVATLPPP